MKIFFNKKEYRALVDMLYLADWVMHSHTAEPENKEATHTILRKKLLSYSNEMGISDIIEYSREYDEYFESQEYEESMHEQYIAPYDSETFWENLIDRLAERDLIKKIGIKKYQTMELMERSNQLISLIKKYSEIFEDNGLSNVNIETQESE